MANHAGSSPGWGGRRPGAGRKKGSVNRRTEESMKIAKKLGTAEPLEIMLNLMTKAIEEGREEMAFEYARAAAPYLHPKLAAQDIEALSEKEDLSVQVLLNAAANDAHKDDDEEEEERRTKKEAG